jgi:hypothetical protein
MRILSLIGVIVCIYFSACNNKADVKSKYHYDEPSLTSFVLSTQSLSDSAGTKQLDSILSNASNDSTAFHQTLTFLGKPFSDPNSSFRKEQLYERLLKAMLNSRFYDRFEKQSASEKLKLLQQNNPGQPANDFTYITPAGYKRKLYDIKANFTLFYFNNPDCPACKEMKAALVASPIITEKTKSGELKVLSMYTDHDEKLWLDSLHTFPPQWIAGRDDDEYLYKHKLYDLRAIPTIYLLDSQKKVLLKDALSVKQIEQLLVNEK